MLLGDSHAAVGVGILNLEPEAGDKNTFVLLLLSSDAFREAPQPGGLLTAGRQPGWRRLVAVGEVLP